MTKNLRTIVYLAGFIISLHLALPAYVSSSFLASVIGQNGADKLVGLIFMAASAVALLGIGLAGRPLRRFGLKRTTINLSLLTAGAGLILALATAGRPGLAIIFFIAFYAGGIVLKFLLDIYLEDLSTNQATGQIRGLFLTLTNLAWLFVPLLVSHLINEIYFERIFILAAAMLVPFVCLIVWPLKNIAEPKYEPASLTAGLKLLRGRSLIRQVLMLNFTLNLFYAFMVIYLPLYLTVVLGLAWQDLGIIFTFMLLPFPLFQY